MTKKDTIRQDRSPHVEAGQGNPISQKEFQEQQK